MGELKLKKEISIKEAAQLFNKSEAFIRKHIQLGVIPVVQFNGKPLKPYRIVYKDLEALFTIAASRSLKTEYVGKVLGRKPLEKEDLWQ